MVIQRGIVRGVTTLLRERQWLTALGALLGVFILVQLLVLVLTGLEGVQSVLRNRTDLRLEIHASAGDADIQEFFSALTELPFVRETVYITKEKAYQETRMSDPELIAFLEEFHIVNPFNDTIGVTLTSLEDYDQFSSFVQKERWKAVVNPTFLSQITDQEKQVFALLAVTRAGRSLTVLILLIACVSLVFITTELIRRRALNRADEVLIERLVGASTLSIAVPFVTEAVLLLLTAVAVSALLLAGFIVALPTLVPALGSQGALGPLQSEIAPLLSSMVPMFVLGEILLIPVMAMCGAWLGIRPQIHTPRISFAA